MFGSFLPSLRSSSNHSLLGSRSRHCYAINCFYRKSTSPVIALIKHVDCASTTFTAIDDGSRMLVAGWLWRGLGGTFSGRGTLYWVGLIVEADYILSDVGGGEEDRAVLGGIVQDGAIAVARCVAYNDVQKFAADGVDYVALGVVDVFLKFILFAF